MSLTPENKALIERELGPLWVRLLDGDGRLNLIIDAARQEGARGGEPAVAGWVVGNGNADRWRAWDQGNPVWVEDREKATRYARREDAEAIHAEDEDAWRVQPLYASPAEPSGWRPTHRHVKRGTTYQVVANGLLQTAEQALWDETPLIIYRGEDGKWWARPTAEFNDGRFEPLAAHGEGG